MKIKQSLMICNTCYRTQRSSSLRCLKVYMGPFNWVIRSTFPQDRESKYLKIIRQISLKMEIHQNFSKFVKLFSKFSKLTRKLSLVGEQGSSPRLLSKLIHRNIEFFYSKFWNIKQKMVKLVARTCKMFIFNMGTPLNDLSQKGTCEGLEFLLTQIYHLSKWKKSRQNLQIKGIRKCNKDMACIFNKFVSNKKIDLNFWLEIEANDSFSLAEIESLSSDQLFLKFQSPLIDQFLYKSKLLQRCLEFSVIITKNTQLQYFFESLQQCVQLKILQIVFKSDNLKDILLTAKFPSHLNRLILEIHDENEDNVDFSYSIEEIIGNNARKMRACNLIDKQKHFNNLMSQVKKLEKLKELKVSLYVYPEVQHIYLLFLYSIVRKIEQIEELRVEYYFAKTVNLKGDICDLNIWSFFELLSQNGNLRSLTLYSPLLSFHSEGTKILYCYNLLELHMNGNIYKERNSLEGDLELLSFLSHSKIQILKGLYLSDCRCWSLIYNSNAFLRLTELCGIISPLAFFTSTDLLKTLRSFNRKRAIKKIELFPSSIDDPFELIFKDISELENIEKEAKYFEEINIAILPLKIHISN